MISQTDTIDSDGGLKPTLTMLTIVGAGESKAVALIGIAAGAEW